MSKENRASRPPVTPFTNKRKTLDERSKRAKELAKRRPEGGDAS